MKYAQKILRGVRQVRAIKRAVSMTMLIVMAIVMMSASLAAEAQGLASPDMRETVVKVGAGYKIIVHQGPKRNIPDTGPVRRPGVGALYTSYDYLVDMDPTTNSYYDTSQTPYRVKS